jgi:hypothetical protein
MTRRIFLFFTTAELFLEDFASRPLPNIAKQLFRIHASVALTDVCSAALCAATSETGQYTGTRSHSTEKPLAAVETEVWPRCLRVTLAVNQRCCFLARRCSMLSNGAACKMTYTLKECEEELTH